jgi:hypothetical protein
MPDRIANDHPTVETFDATIGRHGGTTRPEVRIEADLEAASGSLIRLVLDGQEYRAQLEAGTPGSLVLRHAAPSPSEARNPGTGTNELHQWIESKDIRIGQTVHLDVVEPGFRYGLRAPGEQAVYESGRPDESLAAIAEQFESDRGN